MSDNIEKAKVEALMAEVVVVCIECGAVDSVHRDSVSRLPVSCSSCELPKTMMTPSDAVAHLKRAAAATSARSNVAAITWVVTSIQKAGDVSRLYAQRSDGFIFSLLLTPGQFPFASLLEERTTYVREPWLVAADGRLQ